MLQDWTDKLGRNFWLGDMAHNSGIVRLKPTQLYIASIDEMIYCSYGRNLILSLRIIASSRQNFLEKQTSWRLKMPLNRHGPSVQCNIKIYLTGTLYNIGPPYIFMTVDPGSRRQHHLQRDLLHGLPAGSDFEFRINGVSRDFILGCGLRRTSR